MQRGFAKSDYYPLNGAVVSADQANDSDLINSYKLGNHDSFNVLLMKYGSRVYHHCRRIVDDEAECADLTQEVFLKVFRKLDSYEHTYSFYTWLYRVTVNCCIDHMRKRRRRISEVTLTQTDFGEFSDGELEHEIPDETFCPQERLLTKELSEVLAGAMAKLPARLRSYIILKDIEGFTYNEIAEVYDCSTGTIKSALFNARQKLKQYMTPFVEN